MNRKRLEERVARLEKLITLERSMGKGGEQSVAMKVWTLLKDNGPMTRERLASNASIPPTAVGYLPLFVRNGLLLKNGNAYSANLDYKWDDIGVIPRPARQSQPTPPAPKSAPAQSKPASNIEDCLKMLKRVIGSANDADYISAVNRDGVIDVFVQMTSKAYGDSHTDTDEVSYSVRVGRGYTELRAKDDSPFFPSEWKSYTINYELTGIRSVEVTYEVYYD
jgi:hypothetical protein